MNAEDFVTYEQALALKKLRFAEKVYYAYSNIDEELLPNGKEYIKKQKGCYL